MYYHQYLLHSTSNKSEEGGINLIQNPSFENGLDYWYNGHVHSIPHSGGSAN